MGSAAGKQIRRIFSVFRDWQLEHRATVLGLVFRIRVSPWIAGNLSADFRWIRRSYAVALCAIPTLIFLDGLWIASGGDEHRDRGRPLLPAAGGGPGLLPVENPAVLNEVQTKVLGLGSGGQYGFSICSYAKPILGRLDQPRRRSLFFRPQSLP